MRFNGLNSNGEFPSYLPVRAPSCYCPKNLQLSRCHQFRHTQTPVSPDGADRLLRVRPALPARSTRALGVGARGSGGGPMFRMTLCPWIGVTAVRWISLRARAEAPYRSERSRTVSESSRTAQVLVKEAEALVAV